MVVRYDDSTPNNFPNDYGKGGVDKRVLLRTKSIEHKKRGHDVREGVAQGVEIASVVAGEANQRSKSSEKLSKDTQKRFELQISGQDYDNESKDARYSPIDNKTYPVLSKRLNAIDKKIEGNEDGTHNLLNGTSKDIRKKYTGQGWWDIGVQASNGSNYTDFVVGEELTYRSWIESSPVSSCVRIDILKKDSTVIPAYGNYVKVGNSGYSKVTVTIKDDYKSLAFYPVSFSSIQPNVPVLWAEEKLNEGIVATPWIASKTDDTDFKSTNLSFENFWRDFDDNFSSKIFEIRKGVINLQFLITGTHTVQGVPFAGLPEWAIPDKIIGNPCLIRSDSGVVPGSFDINDGHLVLQWGVEKMASNGWISGNITYSI